MTRVYLCGECLTLAGRDPAKVGFVPANDQMTCWHCGKVQVCYPFLRKAGALPNVFTFDHADGMALPLVDPEVID